MNFLPVWVNFYLIYLGVGLGFLTCLWRTDESKEENITMMDRISLVLFVITLWPFLLIFIWIDKGGKIGPA